jgi:hypothetical protein
VQGLHQSLWPVAARASAQLALVVLAPRRQGDGNVTAVTAAIVALRVSNPRSCPGAVGFRSLRSRPQPDLALLGPRPDYYADGVPGASEMLLLVEVMDTSVEHDRRWKAAPVCAARRGADEVLV